MIQWGKQETGETSNGDQTAWNVYGINLISRKVGADTFNYMYNGHADVTALLDTNGTVAATYYYDAFGNITEQTGSNNNYILYAGYQYDPETGLYYLNARMYDPITARFMQEDTYRGDYKDPLSLNLYTYCHNEPMMYTDPSGHSRIWNTVKSVYNSVMNSRPGRFFTGLALSAVPGFSIIGMSMMAKALLPKTFDKAAKWANKYKGEIAAVATTIALVAGGVAATVLSGGTALPAIMLSSAFYGAAAGVGITGIFDHFDDGKMNTPVKNYVANAAGGALAGALMPMAANAGLGSAATAVWTGLSAGQGDMLSQLIGTGEVNLLQTASAAAAGGVLSYGASKFVPYVANGLKNLSRKMLPGITNRLSAFAANETGAMSFRPAASMADDFAGGVKGAGEVKNVAKLPVQAGEAGSYGDLAGRVVRGDKLTPHHMPQAAAEFTPYSKGGALVLPETEHFLTRTFGGKGSATLVQDAGLSFRQTLYKDIIDVRSISGSKYNSGLRELTNYYKQNFPELMKK